MFKYIAYIAVFCFAAASAGIIETHHVVQEPVIAKVGAVVHSAPSAVSHQSFTRFHNKAVVTPVVAPVVKTTVHEAPVVSVVRSEPLVHTYAAAPVVHSAPLVHSAPYVQAIPAVSVVKAAPVLHAHSVPFVHAAPAAYAIHH